ALRVDLLAKIALPAHERHGDHRYLEIGRRAQRVAGQHAEAAAVRRDGGLERDLHREIADPPARQEMRPVVLVEHVHSTPREIRRSRCPMARVERKSRTVRIPAGSGARETAINRTGGEETWRAR